MRVTDVVILTIPVVTVNVAEVEPCGTVTNDGTLLTAAFELDNDTVAPPAPATDERLTVPVPDWPLTIALGLTERLLRLGNCGLTVKAAVLLTPE